MILDDQVCKVVLDDLCQIEVCDLVGQLWLDEYDVFDDFGNWLWLLQCVCWLNGCVWFYIVNYVLEFIMLLDEVFEFCCKWVQGMMVGLVVSVVLLMIVQMGGLVDVGDFVLCDLCMFYLYVLFLQQYQLWLGFVGWMMLCFDYGECSYCGSGWFDGCKVLIIGGDLGIGCVVVIVCV